MYINLLHSYINVSMHVIALHKTHPSLTGVYSGIMLLMP